LLCCLHFAQTNKLLLIVIVPGNVAASCDSSDGVHSHVLYIFILAQAFHAVGGAILYILALVYIDENVQVHSTPLYIGENLTC
jgi:hypothetical protein